MTVTIRGLSDSGDGVDVNIGSGLGGNGLLDGLGAFEVPTEFASAIERLDGPQMKRSVELMGQCVQVSMRSCPQRDDLEVRQGLFFSFPSL